MIHLLTGVPFLSPLQQRRGSLGWPHGGSGQGAVIQQSEIGLKTPPK
jgi:hypothetical protein